LPERKGPGAHTTAGRKLLLQARGRKKSHPFALDYYSGLATKPLVAGKKGVGKKESPRGQRKGRKRPPCITAKREKKNELKSNIREETSAGFREEELQRHPKIIKREKVLEG